MVARTYSHVHVLMHLLVLGAFRPVRLTIEGHEVEGLNAPSGAGCFPTTTTDDGIFQVSVLMHLLVLGAFRRRLRTR